MMDGIILVVSAAEELENKPQLMQHLNAIKIAKFDNVIVIFNKLDLIKKNIAIERKKSLDKLLDQYDIKHKVIIPTAINLGLGKENILKAIMEFIPPKRKNSDKNPIFYITRSFNVNKNNCDISDLKGGIVGGSLLQGEFKVGDEIEIKPGIIVDNKIKPFVTKIDSLRTDNTNLCI